MTDLYEVVGEVDRAVVAHAQFDGSTIVVEEPDRNRFLLARPQEGDG